jgi:hypothetical protein
MHDVENPPDVQQLMLGLTSTVLDVIQYHRQSDGIIRKTIDPGFSSSNCEWWEEEILIEVSSKHRCLPNGREMPPKDRPTDAEWIWDEYSMLRISSGDQIVMTMAWNDLGWFGHIDPGAWLVALIKWTCFWWCEEGAE